MIPFHAICSAFARLPPFAEPPEVDELGNSLPLSSGIDNDRVGAAMDFALGAPRPPTLTRNLTALRADMGQIAESLQREFDREMLGGREDEAFLDIKLARLTDALIGSVTDWTVPAKVLPLQRFTAISEDFYGIALVDLVASLQGPFPMTNWPVGAFSDTETLGIHTISPDVMHRIANVPIGLICLPTAYAEYPVLWAALAHEICGHDLVRAFDNDPQQDSRLYLELRQSFKDVSDLAPGWWDVWDAWLEEAIADVYGLAVMGPTFAIGMAAWLSATNAASNAYPPPSLGTLTNSIWLTNGKVSEHPPNLMRLHIMAGALRTLAANPDSVAGRYLDDLDAMIKDATGGQTCVEVIDGFQAEVMLRYDTEALARDARAVGAHIAGARLPVLGNKSVADLIPWNAGKEARAEELAGLLHADRDTLDAGLDGDLFSSIVMMAGAMKAVAAEPGRIKRINRRLNRALDHRYRQLRACEHG